MASLQNHKVVEVWKRKDSDMRGVLEPGRRRAYALAGHAVITIRSTKTGERFTYKITEPVTGKLLANAKAMGSNAKPHFVKLLWGPENESDYRYIGTIFPDGNFRTTAKSFAGPDAPSVLAFAWLSRNWESPLVEVWHEGCCGRCGRRLTVPESIASGIGPICAGL